MGSPKRHREFPKGLLVTPQYSSGTTRRNKKCEHHYLIQETRLLLIRFFPPLQICYDHLDFCDRDRNYKSTFKRPLDFSCLCKFNKIVLVVAKALEDLTVMAFLSPLTLPVSVLPLSLCLGLSQLHHSIVISLAVT